MICIADDVPLPNDLLPLDVALAELAACVRPVANGGTTTVSLACVPPLWRASFATLPARYPDVPPQGENRMSAAAWERVLTRLAADLAIALKLEARLRLADQGPKSEDLAEAPLLAVWMPAIEPPHGPLLAGRVERHPRLGTRWIATSLLVGLDLKGGWARTWSRWYRLGRRLTREEVQHAQGRDLRAGVQEVDDGALVRHLAALREEVGALLRPLERRT